MQRYHAGNDIRVYLYLMNFYIIEKFEKAKKSKDENTQNYQEKKRFV